MVHVCEVIFKLRLKSMRVACLVESVALGYPGRCIYQQSQQNIIPHAMCLRYKLSVLGTGHELHRHFFMLHKDVSDIRNTLHSHWREGYCIKNVLRS